MPVTANIRSSYRTRYGIIALVLLGFMAWCLNDGFFSYPQQKRIYDTYIQIRYPQGQGNLENENYLSDWRKRIDQFKAEDGIVIDSVTQPEEKTQMDINTQFVMAGITGLLGFAAAAYFISIGGAYVKADKETGLTTKKFESIAWDSITSVDISRWESKGIAVVHFDTPTSKGVVTLDDWKFDREETVEIYELVKQNTNLIPDNESGDDDEEMDEIA
ncbi:hypothetical protein KS4_11870 [Poriferisphaera corsica]|uniref:Uncharacterized protein n=1 Tax=Poriferisphaera corsica TaxID=2528020 RepID=A0A517YSM0_9BACT|nr:hypothetical protein [Poriferisphaera corsica]QDU33142.1 hypothetical protein KS4_11870 [Poriferisphaera corsica]